MRVFDHNDECVLRYTALDLLTFPEFCVLNKDQRGKRQTELRDLRFERCEHVFVYHMIRHVLFGHGMKPLTRATYFIFANITPFAFLGGYERHSSGIGAAALPDQGAKVDIRGRRRVSGRVPRVPGRVPVTRVPVTLVRAGLL